MRPDEQLPTGLRDIHKDCLRLAGRHYSSKEIARILGISKHTVDQRLRHATRQMGATSRFEAARRFCDLDTPSPPATGDLYDPVLYHTTYLPPHADQDKIDGPVSEKDPPVGTAPSRLRDAQTPFILGDISKVEALLSSSVSTGKASQSPIGVGARSLLVVGIAAISLLAFGATVAALEVLSRI